MRRAGQQLDAGPVAGGALTSAVSWRAIFFVNLPVAIAALALLTRAPRSPRRGAPLDPAGQITAVVALAALTFGVIEGGEAGFGRPLVLGCLLLAAVAMAAFVAAEARVAHPMVPLGLFRSRVVTVCVAIGFAANVGFYGVIFVLSLFFQRVLGQSAVAAGLEFLPMTALLSSANLTSAKVAARLGPRAFIAALDGDGHRQGNVLGHYWGSGSAARFGSVASFTTASLSWFTKPWMVASATRCRTTWSKAAPRAPSGGR